MMIRLPIRVKRVAIISALVIAVLVGVISYFLFRAGYPAEAKLLEDFRTHRASFERLRDMLPADAQVHRLADWGVETDKGIFKPPAGGFPRERFDNYLATLKEIGGIGVSRGPGVHGEAIVDLWASGFGGDTVHVGICSMDGSPSRQIASLDQYYRDHKAPPGNDWIYQHIDGDWYIWTDLWSR